MKYFKVKPEYRTNLLSLIPAPGTYKKGKALYDNIHKEKAYEAVCKKNDAIEVANEIAQQEIIELKKSMIEEVVGGLVADSSELSEETKLMIYKNAQSKKDDLEIEDNEDKPLDYYTREEYLKYCEKNPSKNYWRKE